MPKTKGRVSISGLFIMIMHVATTWRRRKEERTRNRRDNPILPVITHPPGPRSLVKWAHKRSKRFWTTHRTAGLHTARVPYSTMSILKALFLLTLPPPVEEQPEHKDQVMYGGATGEDPVGDKNGWVSSTEMNRVMQRLHGRAHTCCSLYDLRHELTIRARTYMGAETGHCLIPVCDHMHWRLVLVDKIASGRVSIHVYDPKHGDALAATNEHFIYETVAGWAATEMGGTQLEFSLMRKRHQYDDVNCGIWVLRMAHLWGKWQSSGKSLTWSNFESGELAGFTTVDLDKTARAYRTKFALNIESHTAGERLPRAASQPGAPCCINVGTININSLQAHYKIMSDPNRARRGGWVDKHDIAVMVDTKLNESKLRNMRHNFFPGYNETHHTHPEGKWGVSIFHKESICVTGTSSEWGRLHPLLVGRINAIKVNLNPGSSIKPSTEAWFIGVYCPPQSSGLTADDMKSFHYQLRACIRNNMDTPYFYILGDFNAILNHQLDHYNEVRAPTYSLCDRLVWKLMGELDVHDTGDLIEDRHALTHWTYISNNNVTDPKDFSRRRIDHIFTSSLRGVEDTYIDPTYTENPLGVSWHLYDSYSDHNPVSIKINLHTLAGALNPEVKDLPTMTKTYYPVRAQALRDKRIIAQLGSFHTKVDSEERALLDNPVTYDTVTNQVDMSKHTKSLHTILGDVLPKPFQKTFTPGRFNIPISKEMSAIRSTIGRVKAVRRAVLALHRWAYSDSPCPGGDLKRKSLASTARSAVRRYTDKDRLLRFPTFMGRKFSLDEPEVAEWLEEAEAVRKSLWTAYRQQEAKFQQCRKDKFNERYKKEASKYSHQLRVMCYPKDSSETTMAVMLDSGEIVVDKDGILKAYHDSWEQLGRSSPESSNRRRTRGLEDFVRGVPAYDKIRRHVEARSGDITRRVAEEELTSIVNSTPNKACNPLDQVEIATIKIIFNIAEKGTPQRPDDMDEELVDTCRENCTKLRTLILGLINAVLTTRIFPDQLMRGVIVPLFKKGDSRDLGNYRGITLLPIIYKLITKIINNRMSSMISDADGITHAQASGRANFNCLTQVNVFNNVVKHAQRTGKSLFVLSTDVRKAFDTVDFGAFINSLRYMGFDENVMDLIHNLQTGFECTVRSPVGYTELFPIEQGCKQGCALSPLRFNIVYDIFLKYIEHSGKGYKWEMNYVRIQKAQENTSGRGNTLNIPGCAFADDNLIISDNPEEFVDMVNSFSTFLQMVGLHLSPSKCHYTSYLPYEGTPPEVRIRDHTGAVCLVPHRPNSVPLEYLGYLITVGDGDASPAETWKHHNMKVYRKINKAMERFSNGTFRQTESVRILNSDVLSILQYFFAANWMAKRKVPRSGDGEADDTTLAGITHEIWLLVSKKLSCMLNTPRAAVFNKSTGLGFGVDNVEAIYYTAKLDNLLQALQSPSKYCSLTTIDTIGSLRATTGWNALRGGVHDNKENRIPSMKKCRRYPEYIREAGEGLRRSSHYINVNPHWYKGKDCTLLNFIGLQTKGIKNKSSLQAFLGAHGHLTLGELYGRAGHSGGVFATILNSPDMGGLSYTSFRDMTHLGLISSGVSMEARTERELSRLLWSKTKRYHGNMWDNPADFSNTGIMTGRMDLFSLDERHMATDGSYDPYTGEAGSAVVTENGTYMSSSTPGEKSIARAEAYGVVSALLLQKPDKDLIIYTDSQNTIDNIRKVQVKAWMDPRMWRTMNGYSLYKLAAELLNKRDHMGATTDLVHVKAHTVSNEWPSVLNSRADEQAKQARSGPCIFREPYLFLPTYYAVATGGGRDGPTVRTDYMHSRWYRDWDEHLMQAAWRKAGDANHINFLNKPQIWREASVTKGAIGDKTNIFAAKLGVGSLPTPRNIQVTNDKYFPDLYPGYFCPLHPTDESIANEHHIFCKCPATARIRETGLEELLGRIQQVLPDTVTKLPMEALRRMLLPARREDFLYGRTPGELREWVEKEHGRRVAEKLGRKLRPWVTEFFFSVWCQYNKKMVEGEHEFSSRIQKRYGICAGDLRRYGKSARPTTMGQDRTVEPEEGQSERREGVCDRLDSNLEGDTGGDVTGILTRQVEMGNADMPTESNRTPPPRIHFQND